MGWVWHAQRCTRSGAPVDHLQVRLECSAVSAELAAALLHVGGSKRCIGGCRWRQCMRIAIVCPTVLLRMLA